jgi:hypothetical protein
LVRASEDRCPHTESPRTPAKLEHRVPPPIFWAQNPCFLEVTDRVALQNIENNEVPCKIFLDKELRDVSVSVGSFRLTGGAKRTCRTMIGRKTSEDHCATKWENHLQAPAVRQTLAYRSHKVRGFPAFARPPHGRRAVLSPLRVKIASLTPTSKNRSPGTPAVVDPGKAKDGAPKLL